MPIVDLSGAYDLHIHSNPSLFTRSGNDLDMARHAEESGLAGILLKNHFESTVGRAHMADQLVEKTRVFGGLVLNHFAGGLNPVAVEHAIRLGAKQIWMPTIDALGHVSVFGKAGGYDYQGSGRKILYAGIGIVKERDELKEEVRTIVEVIRDSDVMLGTAHLSKEEIFLLARFAREMGLKKLVVTHPCFNPPKLNVAEQVELARLGAMIELCGGNLYPIPGVAKLSDFLCSIREVNPDSLVMSSDAGQPRKSMPAEVLRVFAQCLMEKGVTQTEIDRMTKENPARLLNL
jgi:predicted TIM-barrel fold metal-dependent hydrolase